MKRVIWKFRIPPPRERREFTLELPTGLVEFLDVQCQDRHPVMWALVPAPHHEGETTPHRFIVLGTEEEVDDTNLEYVGTFQITDRYNPTRVFHVFHVAHEEG